MKYIKVVLDPDSTKSSITSESGDLLAVSAITISQEAGHPLTADMEIELFHLTARILRNSCDGSLDTRTREVLEYLPARVLAQLSEEIALMGREKLHQETGETE